MAEIKPKHITELLTYAVQHAKNKQSHLVADVCDIVGRYSSSMSHQDAGFLAQYISEFVDGEEPKSKAHWKELLRVL